MRSLAIVWIATLLVFGLAGTYAQLSYEPPKDEPKIEEPQQTDNRTPDTTDQTTADETPADQNITPADSTSSDTQPTTTETTDDPVTDTSSDPITEEPKTDPVTTDPVPATTPTGGAIAPPDPELTSASAHGPIPATINGREPWRYYARNINIPDNKPRIAIVLTEAGLSERNTTNAFNRLPEEITFAFSPYAKDLPSWLDKARTKGHESLMMVPMEPIDYPKNDPGQHTLLTTLTPAQNTDRLHYVMSRGQGYVGIMNDMGSKYTANRDSMRVVINDLQKRGLMYLDGRTTRFSVGARMASEGGVPRAMNDRYLDNTIKPADIDRYLNDLESVAKTYGAAVGIGRAYPITIGRIALWIDTLAEKGIELVPITAVANRQPIR